MQSKSRILFSSILIAAGIALVVTGIFLGDPVLLFRKAVFVCLECIGLG